MVDLSKKNFGELMQMIINYERLGRTDEQGYLDAVEARARLILKKSKESRAENCYFVVPAKNGDVIQAGDQVATFKWVNGHGRLLLSDGRIVALTPWRTELFEKFGLSRAVKTTIAGKVIDEVYEERRAALERDQP